MKNKHRHPLLLRLLIFVLLHSSFSLLHSQVPNLVSYQGRVAVGTVNFEGTGQFRFALVNTAGTTVYWGNAADTTPADGVPDTAVSFPVSKGLYSVLLGDTAIANMATIPTSVWANADVRLRVWFNDGVNGNQLLTPDQRLAPNGYLADGSVSTVKIATGAVDSSLLATSAVTGPKIASNAVNSAKLASNLTLSGTTSGTFSGNLTGNAATATSATAFTGSLAGDVNGTQGATSIAAATVTGKAITGFSSTTGTITTTDTVLSAINKLDGNVALKAPLASPTFTGTVSGTFSGDGSGLTNLPNSATTGTAANSPNTLVLRDGSGDFAARSLTLSGSLSLSTTTASGEGVISIGGWRVIHKYGLFNFFAGRNSGNLTMTGLYNTASGDQALYSNTTGSSNTASGAIALISNTTGSNNTASGAFALYSNTTGSNNTASGRDALYFNTTGSNNTASGVSALRFNTTGLYNTASGDQALYSNTTGSSNTASGANALNSNTAGSNNTASGAITLSSNTTGSNNTASGVSALRFNTTGLYNTASGISALYSNTTGSNNTAIGANALNSNTTGSGNIAIGQAAGFYITDTHNNICIGNPGVVGDSGIIRIGADGTHQRTILVGNVGIGTTTPVDGKLVVNGGANTSAGQFGNVRYFNPQIDGTVLNWGGGLVSIYATDNIVASGIGLFSDARIKNIAGRSSSVTDLETLQKIEITDYTMKDSVAKGTGTIKKVIAQQVEKAFPQAVTRGKGIVPDIYKAAAVENGWVMHATDLQPGDRVKLIGEKNEAVHEILEVEKGRFRTAELPAGSTVFVYGREVNDLRRVDYDAISMLNVSATQELARRLEAKDAEIVTLKKQLADQAAAIKTLAAKQAAREEALEARFARLEQAAPSNAVNVAMKK